MEDVDFDLDSESFFKEFGVLFDKPQQEPIIDQSWAVSPSEHLLPPSIHWVPFPITLKSKTGNQHRIPKPRIGSIRLGDEDMLFGHVFYGENIQDLPKRRKQPTGTFNSVFVIPPLSSHAVCLDCHDSRSAIAIAAPPLPSPPYAITVQHDGHVRYSSAGAVHKTQLNDNEDNVIVVPYARIFFVSMNPSLEATEYPPSEVELAFNRMQVFVANKYGGHVSNLTPENDGLELLYDPPAGMKSKWTATFALFRHHNASEREVINALNAILYFTRGTARCRDGVAPVYVAYLQMNWDMYQWKTLPKTKLTGPPTTYAYATPPLLNYGENLLCQFATLPYAHQKFSYYTKATNTTWPAHVYSSMEADAQYLKEQEGKDINRDQYIQWFSPNIYNSVNTAFQVSGHHCHSRLDKTSYPIPDVSEVVADLYWALFPDVDGGWITYNKEQDNELKAMTLRKVEAQHRLDWYARYNVVFEKNGSYKTDEQEGHGPLSRDDNVYWNKPKNVVMLRVDVLKPETIKAYLLQHGKLRDGAEEPDRDAQKQMMATLASEIFTREQQIRDAARSADGIGLYFLNLYGEAREFPTPAEGRYRLQDDGVFVRDSRGNYLFCRGNDRFIREDQKIWYGYRRKPQDDVHVLEILKSDSEKAKRSNKFFYKLQKYDRSGNADPKGIFVKSGASVDEPPPKQTYNLVHSSHGQAAQVAIDGLEALPRSAMTDKQLKALRETLSSDALEFLPRPDGIYQYVTADRRYPGVVNCAGKSYFVKRADRTPITLSFREINGHFVRVNPENNWEMSQINPRGWFVLQSDLTVGNVFIPSDQSCRF